MAVPSAVGLSAYYTRGRVYAFLEIAADGFAELLFLRVKKKSSRSQLSWKASPDSRRIHPAFLKLRGFFVGAACHRTQLGAGRKRQAVLRSTSSMQSASRGFRWADAIRVNHAPSP